MKAIHGKMRMTYQSMLMPIYVRLDPTLDDVAWNWLREIEDHTVEMHAIWVTEES